MTTKQNIILIGGGGHCEACIDVIELSGQYNIIGILDRSDLVGKYVLSHKIIGTDNDILKYKTDACQFLITVGQIKSALIRKKLYNLLVQNQANVATVISPLAHVSKYADIGKGSIVMHNAIINANAKIGNNCILNTGCNVEHGALVGDHCHISTGAVINGESKLGNEVFIGSNATISNQLTLTNNVIVGAGAVIVKNIHEPGTYLGNSIIK